MRTLRASALMIAALTLAALVFVSPPAGKASGSGEVALLGSPQAHSQPTFAPVAESTPSSACSAEAGEAPSSANPCHSCPKSLLPACTRVSCEPCCFQCPGEPFLRCL
jgi:hypothetical protein